jgi:xanthine dehydrogenase accessory factor
MDNVDLNVLRQVVAWRPRPRVVLGTITRTWGSAPRPVGSVVAVRGDGQIAGSVSGGCIEDDLIARMRAGRCRHRAPRGGALRRQHRRGRSASACPVAADSSWCWSRWACTAGRRTAGRLAPGERVRRVLTLATGAVTWARPTAPTWCCWTTRAGHHHGPHWRLLLIGAGQMTQYLAQMAQALDYQVMVCDPREEYMPGCPAPRCCAPCPTTPCWR